MKYIVSLCPVHKPHVLFENSVTNNRTNRVIGWETAYPFWLLKNSITPVSRMTVFILKHIPALLHLSVPSNS